MSVFGARWTTGSAGQEIKSVSSLRRFILDVFARLQVTLFLYIINHRDWKDTAGTKTMDTEDVEGKIDTIVISASGGTCEGGWHGVKRSVALEMF